MRIKTILLSFLMILVLKNMAFAINPSDEKKLLQDIAEIKATLKIFLHEVDKRFEQVDKRFEQIDKRFEQIDKRFEEIDKRFEQVNERFRDVLNFLWILASIFTTLTVTVIGFAYWDRRTVIKKARDEAIEQIEKEGSLKNLIKALRELATKDKELATILRNFSLM